MTSAGLLTWTMSGFGDEIDPDPVIQLAVLQALGAVRRCHAGTVGCLRLRYSTTVR